MSQEVRTKVKRVITDRTNGRYIIIGSPTKTNPSGAWTQSERQFENLADQAGLVSVGQLIRNIQDATLTMEAEFRKAGDTYITRNGEEKTIQKDHWQHNNFSVELRSDKLQAIEIAQSVAANQHSFNFSDFMASADPAKPFATEDDANGEVADPLVVAEEQTA